MIDKKEKSFNLLSGIPQNYWNCDIKKIQQNKIKEYIKKKLYVKNGLILYGNIGVGKTYTAISIMKNIFLNEKYVTWTQFVSMSDFILELVSTGAYNFFTNLCANDIVLLDDIDKANIRENQKSQWVKERIFSLFDYLTSNGKIIIGTTNISSIKDLSKILDASIMSRLINSCIFIKIEGNDKRQHGE